MTTIFFLNVDAGDLDADEWFNDGAAFRTEAGLKEAAQIEVRQFWAEAGESGDAPLLEWTPAPGCGPGAQRAEIPAALYHWIGRAYVLREFPLGA